MAPVKSPSRGAFIKLAIATLLAVIAVILWGAVVRATKSGAGCGSHWPMCNGEAIPLAPTSKTLVEFGHRVTSGLSALMVWFLAWRTRREFDAGHPARRAAFWSAIFMFGEVLIGAGIVLLKYVAENVSIGRAIWMSVHLVNTFLLVGALTLVIHHASPRISAKRTTVRWHRALATATVIGTLIVGVSGAIAALGDTLFPAEKLGTALAEELSGTGHVLVRLRLIHPFAAALLAAATLALTVVVTRDDDRTAIVRWAWYVRIGVLAEVAIGLLNVYLLAPVWLQIVHLCVAQFFWVALVQFVAILRTDQSPASALVPPREHLRVGF